jgi:acetoin utilization deacetylase AcuC-like enzyme
MGKISRRRFLGGSLSVGGVVVLAETARRLHMSYGPELDEILGLETNVFDPATSGRFVWNAVYNVSWVDDSRVHLYRELTGHPTLIEKYRAMHQLMMTRGRITETDFANILPIPTDALLLVHDKEYLAELRRKANDPTWIAGTVKPSSYSFVTLTETPITKGTLQLQGAFVNGTYTAARIALEQGVAMNCGGGLHHAKPGSEEGFCIFNDVAVAAKLLQKEGYTPKIMIVDADVHHGNGNAKIFTQDENVVIADIYQKDNYYPLDRIKVECAVPLLGKREYVDDERYLGVLSRVLDAVATHKPDLVFYLAGADPYEGDMLGDLMLTKAGLKERDSRIINGIRSLNIPVAVTLAGGYAENPNDLVEIHYNTAMVVKEAV